MTYGFNISAIYVDPNTDPLPNIKVERGVADQVPAVYAGEFRYLDTQGRDLSKVEKVIEMPEAVPAPVEQGAQVGLARYMLDGTEIGSIPLLYGNSVEKAKYKDCLNKIFHEFLL